jgi:RimJ/RimL family protein N-acetyltransferase
MLLYLLFVLLMISGAALGVATAFTFLGRRRLSAGIDAAGVHVVSRIQLRSYGLSRLDAGVCVDSWAPASSRRSSPRYSKRALATPVLPRRNKEQRLPFFLPVIVLRIHARHTCFLTPGEIMRRIYTERLVLRPREQTDDLELHRILMDAMVMERVFAGGALASPEACQQFIHDDFAGDGEEPIGIGTLSLRSDGRVIGFAGLIPCNAAGYEDDVEFGVVLATPYQREGYATEISRAMIDLALGELGYPRVLALTHPGNDGGRAVLARLGLRFIEEVPAGDRKIRRVYSRSRSEEG